MGFVASALCAGAAVVGAFGCGGTLGGLGTDEGGAGGDATKLGGMAGAEVGGADPSTTTPTLGSGGAGASAAGGYGGATSAGGAGTGAGPTGGTGGAPPTCILSGPKDCSPPPNSLVCDGVVPHGYFHAQVTAAVQYVRDLPANSSWFDYDGQFPCCPIVGTGTGADKTTFRDAVLDRLNSFADLCAQADPGNHLHEITVKRNNDCSEGYLIVTSAGVVRNPAKDSYACAPDGP